jgi:signal transduction histidine kinase
MAAGLVLLTFGLSASAQTATEDDVKALVKKAVAHLHKNGLESACKDFANPTGGFIQGELYIYVQDMKAKMICHGTNPKLNGKDLIEMADADGKTFNKEMIQVVSTKGSGWVNYKFMNPVSKKIEPKVTFVEREGEVMVGAGMYKH